MLISRHGFRAFTEYDLRANLEQFLVKIRKEIESDSDITTSDENEYVQKKIAENTIHAIEFDVDGITITQREEMIDARYFPSGFMVDRGERYSKPVITFHIPFSGDEKLIHCSPSSMLSVSDEVAVDRGNVTFDVINFSNNAELVAKERDEVVARLVQKAGFVNKDLSDHNTRLEGVIRESFQKGKINLENQSDFLGKLGNKVKDD